MNYDELKKALTEMDQIFGDKKEKLIMPIMHYKVAEQIIGREFTKDEKSEMFIRKHK